MNHSTLKLAFVGALMGSRRAPGGSDASALIGSRFSISHGDRIADVRHPASWHPMNLTDAIEHVAVGRTAVEGRSS